MTLDQDLQQLEDTGRWRALTAVPKKFRYFSRETYFRESWQLARKALGARTLETLQRLAVLTLKPDCVIGRRVEDCITYMAERGFRPILVSPIRYGRSNTREIWRYQWNIATLDRLNLGDVIHTAAPALMVVFTDEHPDDGIPASVRLAGLKGSSLPWDRHPDDLRSRLGGLNRMIVLVHCSDEPVDIVREWGILFDRRALAGLYDRLVEAVADPVTPDLDTPLRSLYARHPPGELGIEAALAELDAALSKSIEPSRAAAAARVAGAVHAARQGDHLDWQEWFDDLRAARLGLDAWTTTVIGSHYIRHDVPGAVCIISESGRERWLAGEGLFLS
ncbi:hypothetical protein ABZ897_57435 [Nonomuraea sp. NPDC046802]|uniref:hypothetical protein n=1 Tax=Nonomuraea sp. NPDC046802 TaxID=3154919 RepID=UPI0033D4E798